MANTTRIGIIIIGSLYWRNERVRVDWRKARLQADHAIRFNKPF